MNFKIIINFLVALVMFSALALAVNYPFTPKADIDMQDHAIYNITTANIETLNVSGSTNMPVNWTMLQNFPPPAATGYAITQLLDSLVTTYFAMDGASYMEDINGDGYSIFNLTNTTSDGVYTDTLGSKSGAGITWTTSQDANGQDLSDVDVLEANEIAGALIVESGNASDIIAKLDQCPTNVLDDMCTVFVPAGRYEPTERIIVDEYERLILDDSATIIASDSKIDYLFDIREHSKFIGGLIKSNGSDKFEGTYFLINITGKEYTRFTEIKNVLVIASAEKGTIFNFLAESGGSSLSRFSISNVETENGRYSVLFNMSACVGGANDCYMNSNRFVDCNFNYGYRGFWHLYTNWDSARCDANYWNNVMIHPRNPLNSYLGFETGCQRDYYNIDIWDVDTGYQTGYAFNFTGLAGGNFLVTSTSMEDINDVSFNSRGNTIFVHTAGGSSAQYAQIPHLTTLSIESTTIEGTFQDSEISDIDNLYIPQISDILIAYNFQNESQSDTNIYDSSMYRGNGTINTGVSFISDDIFGLVANTTSGDILITKPNYLFNDFSTISSCAWFKPSDTDVGTQKIFMPNQGHVMYIYSNYYRFQVRTASDTWIYPHSWTHPIAG